jgi:energy-coupling factor transport system ATP-binding protein
MSYIEIKNLKYAYKDDNGDPIPVLRDISLNIEKGEYVAVLGHNGSGKSTLAKLLNLVIDDYDFFEGSIFVDGVDITSEDMTEDDIYNLRKKIGMVFQNPDNQLVATQVEEDVAFGPENLGLPREELQKRVDDALARVGMTEFKDRSPHHLSGGQKQRVAIAGVIAMEPACIVLDEATAMLDPQGRKEVMRTVEELHHDRGITVIHITHYMEEAIRADRVVVINDGELFLDGTPDEVFSHVEELRSVGLEAPQSLELIWELRRAGVDVPEVGVSEEACLSVLKDLLSAKK